MIELAIHNGQSLLTIDTQNLETYVRRLLDAEGITAAQISLAIVDDRQIHEVNRRFLEHDYPTDVLSFCFSDGTDSLEGEVIVSAETAVRQAAQFGLTSQNELLLYVVHGLLHLVGYRDKQPEDVARMRARERHFLSQFTGSAISLGESITSAEATASSRESWR